MAEISVIVPIYNGELFIEKCIQMILNQTFMDFELILVNDGSTDKSIEICNQYANKDNRIKVINKENGGAWSARNVGINVSSSKYTLFLDCDDEYEENLLQEMYEAIENNNADLVICGQNDVYVDKTGEVIKKIKVLPGNHYFNSRKEILDNYIFLRKKDISDILWNKIYKTEIIKKYKLKFEDFKRGEDTIFNINYYEKIERCIIMNKSLYNYRVESSNPVWLKYSENYYDVMVKENEIVIDKLRQWGRYDKDAIEYQSNWFIYGIIAYFNWIVYPKNNFNFKDKYEKVVKLISEKEVTKFLDTVNETGKFHRLIIASMKSKNAMFILFLVQLKLRLENVRQHKELFNLRIKKSS